MQHCLNAMVIKYVKRAKRYWYKYLVPKQQYRFSEKTYKTYTIKWIKFNAAAVNHIRKPLKIALFVKPL